MSCTAMFRPGEALAKHASDKERNKGKRRASAAVVLILAPVAPGRGPWSPVAVICGRASGRVRMPTHTTRRAPAIGAVQAAPAPLALSKPPQVFGLRLNEEVNYREKV